MQIRDRVVPGAERIDPGLEPAGAPDQQDRAHDDPGDERRPDLGVGERLGRRHDLRHGRSRFVVAAQGGRGPDFPGLPDLEEADQAGHRDQRGADVDDPGIDEVRDQVLRDRERYAAHQDGRPDLHHAAAAGEYPDQPERHDEREERQLSPDHGAEQIGIDPRHARQSGDRCAERAVSDRRGIGDERKARGRERREAEPDQDRAGHRHRRAEAGRALEERAERECDQQQLQAAVIGDAADGCLQRLEGAFRHREPVEKDDVEDDPADREEAGHRAEHGCAQRHARGHGEDEDRHQVGDDQRDDGGDMGLDLVGRDQHQQRHHRQRGGDGRQHCIVERIVDLIPHGPFPQLLCSECSECATVPNEAFAPAPARVTVRSSLCRGRRPSSLSSTLARGVLGAAWRNHRDGLHPGTHLLYEAAAPQTRLGQTPPARVHCLVNGLRAPALC